LRVDLWAKCQGRGQGHRKSLSNAERRDQADTQKDGAIRDKTGLDLLQIEGLRSEKPASKPRKPSGSRPSAKAALKAFNEVNGSMASTAIATIPLAKKTTEPKVTLSVTRAGGTILSLTDVSPIEAVNALNAVIVLGMIK
jgi:hypothetical protein